MIFLCVCLCALRAFVVNPVFGEAPFSGADRMMLTIFCLLALAEPITPSQLHDALQVPPRGKTSEVLAERIRAAYPAGVDLKAGAKPLVDGSMVAFIVE